MRHVYIPLLLAALALPGTAQAYGTAKTINFTTTGQNMTFNFTGLPKSTGNVTVRVSLYGDFDAASEYAEVWIDNAKQATHQGSSTHCNTVASTKSYTVAASAVADGKMVVRVDASSNVGATCSTNRAVVIISYGAMPDLRISASSVPYSGSTAGAGSTFRARYTISNFYQYLSNNFYVNFYYCPTTSTSGCSYLGNQFITSNFASGQSRTFTSGNLTLPTSVMYGTGYVRIFVDSSGAVSEANEANNNRYDAISITDRPDLYITSSTVPYSGSTSAAGSQFTGRYTVRNRYGGSRLTTNFYVRYYYCTSASTSSCTGLSSQLISADLNAGASYTFNSPTLTMPSNTTAGLRYIRAFVDVTGAVKESNENNNNDYDSIFVSGLNLVDLRVNYSAVPYGGSTAGAGSTFKARYRIRNYGVGSFITNFYTRFYYCPGASTSGCTYLGVQYITQNFNTGTSAYFTSPTLTMPSTAAYGTRYIRIYADASNAVKESNENNNNRYDSISVTTRPDLSFSASTVPYSGSTALPGSKFTGRYTVVNGSKTSAFSTNFVVRYYYCATTSASSCTYLAAQTITKNFNAGTSYTFNSPTLTMPSSAKAGTRYIRAWVDSTNAVKESKETNNVDMDPITVGGPADLVVDYSAVPFSGSTAGAGSTFTARYRIRNSGVSTVTANFYTYFYFCVAASSSGCVLLGKQAVSTNFASKQAATFTSPTLKIPVTAFAGTRYIRIYADATNVVKEASDKNNERYDSISVTTLPDLSFSAAKVPFSGSAGKPGAKFTGKYTVRNGPKTSRFTTNFYARFYYCPAKSAAGCSYLAARYVTTNFHAGSSYAFVTPTLTIPAAAKAGTRYIRALVDATGMVKESNEKNNEVYNAITVGSTKKPDLYVKSLSIKTSGTQVTYTATVCNAAGAAAAPASVLALYYNLATAPGCSSKASKTVAIVALKAGACQTRSVVRKGAPKGGYVGWARADAACKVAEGSENNNNAKRAYTVTPPVADQGVPDSTVPADITVPPVDGPVPTDAGVPDLVNGVDATLPSDSQPGEGTIPADLPVFDWQAEGTTTADLPVFDWQAEGTTTTDLPVFDWQAEGTTTTDLPVFDWQAEGTTTGDGTIAGDGGVTGDLGEPGTGEDGCSCAVSGDGRGAGLWLLLALAALLGIRRRY